ncbi:MAG: HD domain-containing protein [Acidimicrobiaceae bacterium]|nr:HD domain-containing protein [Acidimicrobiaceae bacterium]
MTVTEPTTNTADDSFRRMDESTAEQWAHIGRCTAINQPRVADRILMLLQSLADIRDGFLTDQLTHSLQTATMAERAGADEEMVFASLCHDIGKAISVSNHGAISAEIIKPYVRDEVYQTILNHQDFQGRHYYHHFGAPRDLRDQFQDESWFALCEQFTDDWDQQAFDPDYDTLPLEHFEPLVRRITAAVSSGASGT